MHNSVLDTIKLPLMPSQLKQSYLHTVHQNSFALKPPCLLAKESLRGQGYSDEVVACMMNPIRDNVKSCYEAKWNSFVEYVKGKYPGKVPEEVTIPQLADFFQYFVEKNYKPSVIQG